MSIFYLRQHSIRVLKLSIFTFFISATIQAQSFNIDDHDGTIIRTCEASFYDSGGTGRGYSSGENYAVTFCPEEGTAGKLIRFFFLQADIRGILSADQICFFDGNSVNSPRIDCISEGFDTGETYEVSASDDSPSGCVTVTFTSGILPTNRDGWFARVICIDKCPKIESRLVSSDPPIDNNGFINVCPNQEIEFFGAGDFPSDFDRADAAEFSWYFGDGQKADVVDAKHAYEQSGGYKLQLSIVDPMTGCTNLNDIDIRVRVSPKPQFELASELTQAVCAGDTVSLSAAVEDGLNTSGKSIIVRPDTSAFLPSIIRSDSLALPDGEGNAYASNIFFDNFAANSTFQDSSDLLSVCVNMEHSWARDLQISLRCPTGKEVILHNFMGQTGSRIRIGIPNEGDNTVPVPGVGADYCWTPFAENDTWLEYSDANAPNSPISLPAGEYLPFQNFNEFIGCPLNGQWTIEVEDLWAIDNGYIFNWQLNFDTQLYSETDPFSPAITDFEWQQMDNLIYHSRDSIASVPVDAGGNVFNFKITDEYGCVFDTLATVPILPPTHPDCISCFDYDRPFTLLADTTICNGDELELGLGETQLYDTIRFVNMQEYDKLGNTTHPPTTPYESIININNMLPDIIADPNTEIAQICLTLSAPSTEFISDYDIALQTPSGELLQLVLFQLFVDVGNDLTQTCFTPSASTSLNNGTSPFTGDFSPIGDWADLTGASKNGDWKLVISDRVMGPALSTLKDWSITFVSSNEVNYSWTAATGLSCLDCPNPTVTPASSADYILRTRDNFNCSYRDTVSVTNIGDFEAPEVICTVIEDDGLLRIDWTPQEGIEAYEISINGSDFEVPNFNFFSHGVMGLDINEEITIGLRAALDNIPDNLNCDIPTTEATCIYNACAFKVAFTQPPTAVSCPGDTDGAASVEVTEGITPFAFVLDGVEIQNSSVTTLAFDNLAVGEHELVVLDGDACSDTLRFMIDEPLPIQIEPIVSNVSCKEGDNGTIDLSITGGTGAYTYIWNDTSSDTLLTNVIAATYTVTVSDEKNCESSVDIEVNEPEALLLELSSTTAACFNTTDGTADVIATGGTGAYTYAWSNGEATNAISDLIPNIYTVSVTDENDCLSIGEVEVIAPAAIIVDSIQQVAVDCNGTNTGMASVNISGGTEPYIYQWSDDLGQTAATAQLLPAGDYIVTISDANNCSTEASISVTEPVALSIAFDASDANCFGGEDGTAMAIPTGGVAPYQYTWDDATTQSTQTAVELTAATYRVIVTDANNCISESDIVINEPATAVSGILTQNLISCHGEGSSQAIIEPSGGTGDYNYLWSDGQIKATAIDLDTTTYQVTVTDENACEFVTSIQINDFEPFEININASSPSCSGTEDGALGATVIIGGTGEGYEYAWDTEPASTGFFIEGLQGDRTYTLTVTDSQGCEGIEDFPLAAPNPITLDLANTDVLCTGEGTGTISIVDIQGGNPANGYSIQWDTNADSSTEQIVNGLAIGTYSVTATDELGCFGTAEIAVGQPNSLAVSFGVINNGCNNAIQGEITAVASGGIGAYSFNWSTGSIENTIRDLSSGTYTLTITDENGCVLESTAEVEQPGFIDAQASIEREILCVGGNEGRIALNPMGGTPPYNYSLDGSDYSSSSQFIGLGAGVYDVFVQDANGCVQNTTVELFDPPAFSVFISPRQDIVEIGMGDSIQIFVNSINATGIVDWEWTPSFGEGNISCFTCSDPIVRPETTIYYELYGIDENGCEATDLVQIRVLRDERKLLVPTGFSPNGDGENDRLLIHSKEEAIVRYFQLYDRWGELVYEMNDFPVNDATFGWDGMFRNKEMPTGSYIWTAEVEYPDGKSEVFKGNTTLIR